MKRNYSLQFGVNLNEGLSSKLTITEVTLAGFQSEVIWTGRLYVESTDLLGVTRSGWNK